MDLSYRANVQFTFEGCNNSPCLDHLLTSRHFAFCFTNVQKLDIATNYSDHHPISCVFDWGEPERAPNLATWLCNCCLSVCLFATYVVPNQREIFYFCGLALNVFHPRVHCVCAYTVQRWHKQEKVPPCFGGSRTTGGL